MPASTDPYDVPEPPRPWYQTTIRELLLLTTLAALTLSVLKTVGLRDLVALGCSLSPFLVHLVAALLRFRKRCRDCGIWDPPRIEPMELPNQETPEEAEARWRARRKREAFLELVPHFVGRRGLYLDRETARPVQVERVVAGFDCMHARLRGVPERVPAKSEKHRWSDKRWEISQVWAEFEFSETEWDASRGEGWRLSFSEE